MKYFTSALTAAFMLTIILLHCNGVAIFYCEKQDNFEYKEVAIIFSDSQEKQYIKEYNAKIDNKKYILYVNKNQENLEYGDIVILKGKYIEPSDERNYNGYNYKLYLKTQKIFGTYKIDTIKKIGNLNDLKSIKSKEINFSDYNKNQFMKLEFQNNRLLNKILNKYNFIIYKIRKNIKKKIFNNFPKENATILTGILIGEKSEMEDITKQKFESASLSHLLAISGAHFAYIYAFLIFIIKKIKNKKIGIWLTIAGIIFFISLTNYTSSVLRAGIIILIMLFGKILHRRVNSWNSIIVSILIQIIINPYVIFNISAILSYSGVFGILLFQKYVEKMLNKIFNKKNRNIINKLISVISVSISANIIITPIIVLKFNKIYTNFIISNILAGSLVGIIIILGFISIILNIKIVYFILNIFINIFNTMITFCGKLPMSFFITTTPSKISIFLIYILIFLIWYKINKKSNYKRISLIVILLIIMIIFFNLKMPLKDKIIINFVDVGQGDCTLIRTKSESILIDSGGSTDENYDVGKQILFPYLMSRKIKTIDFVLISHFDADHCQGLIYILKTIKVKKIIIAKQPEKVELYNNILKLAKEKGTEVIIAKKGNIFNIGDIKLKILFPENDFIEENKINNNAVLCKLVYNKFSMLFTGDLEKPAEEKILKYENINELKSTILKVGHHGSKTSTTDEFLNEVNPKIALIGVGKNNKFNHPNKETIEKLNLKKVIVFRTDKDGEVSIIANKDGKIKILTCKKHLIEKIN